MLGYLLSYYPPPPPRPCPSCAPFAAADNIINPTVPLALRVSGHLLLGLVRIYSRKVKYLMSDASEALVKIKMVRRTKGSRVILPTSRTSRAGMVAAVIIRTCFIMIRLLFFLIQFSFMIPLVFAMIPHFDT